MSVLTSQLDLLIREGKIATATAAITKMNLAKVPRKQRQELAKICRRVGLIGKGLRLLQPVIRHQHPLAQPPSAGEICEYAVLLSRNGSIDEALGLLKEVRSNQAPEALLYQGFLNVSNWDYSSALKCFTKFLQTNPDDYMALIAQVNLNASLIETGQLDNAESSILSTIEIARERGATRLIGNAFELLAQVHFQRHDFPAARTALNSALEIFAQGQSYDRILVEKWLAFITAQEQKSVTPLLRFRKQAIRERHWHSVREVDYMTLQFFFNQNTFDHLYYGTPMKAYRTRLIEKTSASPSSQFEWGPKNWEVLIGLNDGRCEGCPSLKTGGKTHQVLVALSSDLYEPSNTGRLFGLLYPGEYFDVESSPLRIRQALRRTRGWLEANRLPVSLAHGKSGYKINIEGKLAFGFSSAPHAIHPRETQRTLLLEKFPPGRWFATNEAMELLNCSRSSFHRFAEDARAGGWLLIQGKGKSVRYQFTQSSAD